MKGGGQGAVVKMNNGTFTMNDGMIKGSYMEGVVHLSGGTMYANGGTIQGQGALESENAEIKTESGKTGTEFKGKVVFDGGTVSGGIYQKRSNEDEAKVHIGSGTTTISGGSFEMEVIHNETNGTLTIEGGTFCGAVTIGASAGGVKITDGEFRGTVTIKDNVASKSSVSGGTFYGTVNAPETVNTSAAKVKVTFDTKGGSEVEPIYVLKGQKATVPTDPTRLHGTFEGWYKDSATSSFDFSTPITEDLTLTARWTIDQFRLTVSGGAVTVPANVSSGLYEFECDVTITAAPAPEGYQFKEWSGLDGVNFVNYSDKTSSTVRFLMAGEDLNVEAIYELKPASGGSYSGGSSGGSYSGGSTYIPPKEPEKEPEKEPTLADRTVGEQQAVQSVYAWRFIRMIQKLSPLPDYGMRFLTEKQQKTLFLKLYPDLTDELWELYMQK